MQFRCEAVDELLAGEFGDFLATVTLTPPRLPVISNLTGMWAAPEQMTVVFAQSCLQPHDVLPVPVVVPDRFLSRLAANHRLLEVGPGHGLLLAVAADGVLADVAGWDVSPASLAATRVALNAMGSRPVELAQRDLNNLDASEIFDAVVASELLLAVRGRTGPPARPITEDFAVMGAGQSAAEVATFLHDEFRTAHVHVIVPRYGFTPADDSPFVNGVFDPGAVDEFFFAAPAVKERFFRYHANTNYSVVDIDLIGDLYRRVYQERVLGPSGLHIHRMSRVRTIETRDDGVRVVLDSSLSGAASELAVDIVVCATGYAPMDADRLLGPLDRLCRRDGEGRVIVRRDHRVLTDPTVGARIFLQGGTEHTHGLSASLLSNVAVRAGEIVTTLERETVRGNVIRA